MADAPVAQLPDNETLARRTQAIVEVLAGPNWLPPLSEAEGAELAIWVLARALAPFYATVPKFNWAGIGSIQGTTFPYMSSFGDSLRGTTLNELEMIRLFVTPVGRNYPGLDRPVLTIGIRRTEPPRIQYLC